jgi:hypothetical protein
MVASITGVQSPPLQQNKGKKTALFSKVHFLQFIKGFIIE